MLNAAPAAAFNDAVPAMDKPEPTVQLTAKERSWLVNHKKIMIAFDGSLPPYSFVNDAGRLEGIAVEVMNTLGRRLGVQFETYPNTTWNKLYEAAAEHKVDVVATMVNRPDRSQWFVFTKPYLMKSLVIITRKDDDRIKNRTDLAGKTVTMIKGYQYVEQVIGEFPSVIPYFVDSMLDGLNAVNKQKADAAIFFMATASYPQTKYLLTNLKLPPFTTAIALMKALRYGKTGRFWQPSCKKPWIPSVKRKCRPSMLNEFQYSTVNRQGADLAIAAAFVFVLLLLLLWIVRVAG